MTSNARRERLERDLASLEAEFRVRLMAALEQCAAGAWGLFGQNNESLQVRFGKTAMKRYESPSAQALTEMTTQIEDLRTRLGYTEPFPLCERFKAYRAMRGSNVPGEPKLAQTFLEELRHITG